jgi:hypothetical protein
MRRRARLSGEPPRIVQGSCVRLGRSATDRLKSRRRPGRAHPNLGCCTIVASPVALGSCLGSAVIDGWSGTMRRNLHNALQLGPGSVQPSVRQNIFAIVSGFRQTMWSSAGRGAVWSRGAAAQCSGAAGDLLRKTPSEPDEARRRLLRYGVARSLGEENARDGQHQSDGNCPVVLHKVAQTGSRSRAKGAASLPLLLFQHHRSLHSWKKM